MARRLLIVMLPGLALLLAVPLVQRAAALVPAAVKVAEPSTDDRCAGDHWVAAWRGVPQGSSGERTFVEQTLRMVVAPTIGGSTVRVHLGNRFGTAPVRVTSATIGLQDAGASIMASSLRTLTFEGAPGTTIGSGWTATSDPVELDVRPLQRLVVSFHVEGTAALDHHQWAMTTSYASTPGDHTASASADAFGEAVSGWYGIAGIDVLTPRSVGAVAAVGDSITDGIGSTLDADRRWTDVLARRFDAAGIPLAVVNAGMGGNHVATSGLSSPDATGPSIVERLHADALSAPGVTDVVVFAGVNDVFRSTPVDAIVTGYEAVARRARAAGMRVIGATITPSSLSPEQEAARVGLNEWIRSSSLFDAVVDFDAVVRDPSVPSRILPAWDAGYAHLTDAGYEALAGAVPLDVFRGTGC